MKRFTKFVSVIICLVLVLSMVPAVYSAEGEVFVKVTDAADLAIGDQVIIVAVKADYALGTLQKADNRQAVAITKEGDTVTATADVQVLTLEAGVVEGTFAFNTGEGYLFAASSSRNYLRTEETLSANSSWSIAITDGVASVVAQGENTRATMQYNPNTRNKAPLFACYAGASQGDIAIYRLEGDEAPEDPLSPGSKLNPVKLTVAECPTQSVVIPAGQMVWYQLDDEFIIKDYCLEVLGENAYIYCDDVKGLAWDVKDFYYYAENGVATFCVYATEDNLIRIGNLGEEDASFTINAYIPETTTDMVQGDNTIWLPRNTNGHDFYWTAQEDGAVTIRVTGEAWLFYAGIATGSNRQFPGQIHWSVEGDSNTVTFAVSAGDTVRVYLTTLDADVCNPGGTLNVNFAFKPAGICEIGDVSGDGQVDTTDAKLVMQYDLGLIAATALDLTVADVNNDGLIDTTDAKLIMQLDLGLIPGFPNAN